jgi:NADPH-dependent 2,4-dienoyl-CoA reductase/sulfur reductase-like enzyme/rhodanese-related sulfurtransferase
MKILIIGAVAGGASAAARARRLSEDAQIVMIERGPDVSFANCGLPYYIGGEIADRGKLLVTSRERLRDRYKLDVRVRSEAEFIDRTAKTVRIRDHVSGGTYQESYDKLILAPGAAPVRPSLPGANLPGVFTLRTLQDMDAIAAALDSGAKSAVVVGGGFIGLELVENFVRRGVFTTVVEVQEQVLPPFDREMTRPISRSLGLHGVDLRLGDSAESFEEHLDSIHVQLKSGEHLRAKLVVLGVGVRPENRLAVQAGLSVGERGGIRVNEHLQTDDPNIYAVGDAIEVVDAVLGGPAQVPLAGPANRQGRIAADNALGRQVRYRGTQGTAIVSVFGVTAAITGVAEKQLRRSGRPYHVIYVHPAHHAGYFPGAERMTIKLAFEPGQGRVLGAQVVGGAGVDKRIDVLATAIQARMTVFDLEEMELAYAPQFGSAKDPVNMAGFVGASQLRGDHPQISPTMLAGEQVLYLDVRTQKEFASGTIPGAVNIPLDELRSRFSELPQDRNIVAFCQVGQRGYMATRILLHAGFHVRNLSGGFEAFELAR